MTDVPDLTNARVYRVTDPRMDHGDRWYVLDETVWYRNSEGELRRAIVAGHTITSSPSWTDVTDESDDHSHSGSSPSGSAGQYSSVLHPHPHQS